jgi:hypothetical protein
MLELSPTRYFFHRKYKEEQQSHIGRMLQKMLDYRPILSPAETTR